MSLLNTAWHMIRPKIESAAVASSGGALWSAHRLFEKSIDATWTLWFLCSSVFTVSLIMSLAFLVGAQYSGPMVSGHAGPSISTSR